MHIVPTRIDLIKMLPAGSVIAEIGCHKAHFAIQILNECPNIAKLICVDRWKKATNYVDPLSDEDHEENFRMAKHHCRGHAPGGRIQFVRGDSLHVAENDRTIPPLTAVYVDADHSFEACYADLVAWSKRLSPGGVLLGHDFTNCAQAQKWNFGVIPAVNKFCVDHGWLHTHLSDEEFASFRLERI